MGCAKSKEDVDSDDEKVIKWQNPAQGSSDEESDDESYAERSQRLKAERASKKAQEQKAQRAAQRRKKQLSELSEEESEEEDEAEEAAEKPDADVRKTTRDVDFDAALSSYADKDAAVAAVAIDANVGRACRRGARHSPSYEGVVGA